MGLRVERFEWEIGRQVSAEGVILEQNWSINVYMSRSVEVFHCLRYLPPCSYLTLGVADRPLANCSVIRHSANWQSDDWFMEDYMNLITAVTLSAWSFFGYYCTLVIVLAVQRLCGISHCV